MQKFLRDVSEISLYVQVLVEKRGGSKCANPNINISSIII